MAKAEQAMRVLFVVTVFYASVLPLLTATAQEDCVPSPLITKSAAAKHRDRVLSGPFGIPKSTDVKMMTAEIIVGAPYGEPVERFDVPISEVDRILSNFQHAEIDTDPILTLPEMGSLVIRTHEGKSRRVCWYAGAKAPLMFSVNGVRCISKKWSEKRPDEGSLLGADVRRIWEGKKQRD